MKMKILNFDDVPDCDGETFDPKGVEVEDGYVPVKLEYQDTPEAVLGRAKLVRLPDGVYAEVEFFGKVPSGMQPGVGGSVFARQGKVIKHCRIRSVGITARNSDLRIPRIP